MAQRGYGGMRGEGPRQNEGPTIEPVEKALEPQPSNAVTSNNKIIFVATSLFCYCMNHNVNVCVVLMVLGGL